MNWIEFIHIVFLNLADEATSQQVQPPPTPHPPIYLPPRSHQKQEDLVTQNQAKLHLKKKKSVNVTKEIENPVV